MKRFGYIFAPRVRGNLDLGPGAWLAAPAGIIGAFNTSGNVFFVDFFNGNNAWSGALPERDGTTTNGPFQTIAFALTQCVADHDDYIIVLDSWNEATPILVNTSRVHIIGLSSNPARPYPLITATGATAVFRIGAAGDNCEIAGFGLGGGVAQAGIEQIGGGVFGVYIHDCVFGHIHSGNTPLMGIYVEGDLVASRIERCKFLGNGGGTGGLITGNGIQIAFGLNSNTEIVDNIFQGLDIAMNLASANIHGMLVKDNVIAINANTLGGAVTLGVGNTGVLVVGNKAMFGDTAGGMPQNPYSDLAGPGVNHWAANMKGAAFVDPA